MSLSVHGYTALHSDPCVMNEVNCVCGMQVKQKDMDAHKEDSCSWKKISYLLNSKNMIERFVLFLSFLRCLPTNNNNMVDQRQTHIYPGSLCSASYLSL